VALGKESKIPEIVTESLRLPAKKVLDLDVTKSLRMKDDTGADAERVSRPCL
jgi:hypothetical protein